MENSISKEERTWAMLAHLLTIAGYLVGMAFLPPLVILLVKKDESEFVADQAKESLNFQITVFLALLVAAAMICIVVGVFLLPVIAIAAMILAIVAAIKANEGVRYRYPLTLRLIT